MSRSESKRKKVFARSSLETDFDWENCAIPARVPGIYDLMFRSLQALGESLVRVDN